MIIDWLFWVYVAYLTITTAYTTYSVVSAYRTPKARPPKSPDQVFDFMGAEAKADEGAIVPSLWGRNKIGGQILQLHRDFNNFREVLTMIIGLGEGKSHIFDNRTQMLDRVFVNDQPLRTYVEARPSSVDYYTFTRGDQTTLPFPDWVYGEGTKVNYTQSAVLDNNNDEFTYRINNKFAERIKVGLAFMKGLVIFETIGVRAGDLDAGRVLLQFSYRDMANPDVWIPTTPSDIVTQIKDNEINKDLLVNNNIIGIGNLTTPKSGGKYIHLKSIKLKMGTISSNVKLELLKSHVGYIYVATGIISTFTQENEKITFTNPIRAEINSNIAFKVITAGSVEKDGYLEIEYDVIYDEGGLVEIIGTYQTTHRVEHVIDLPAITDISNPKQYEIRVKQIGESLGVGEKEEAFDEVTVAFIEEIEVDKLMYPNTCLLVLRFTPNAQLSGTTPRIQTIADGLYIYTLEEGSAPYIQQTYLGFGANEGKIYGRNPACILYTIYRDILGKSEADLDIASFKDCRDKAFTYNVKFDLAVEAEMSMEDFVEEFKSATGFIPIPSNGKIVLTYDKDQFNYVEGSIAETSSYDFTDNSVEPFGVVQWQYTDNIKVPNTAEVTFRDEENNFEEKSILMVREDLLAYESQEPVSILFNGITNIKQATERANVIINTKRLETIQLVFKTNTKAFHLAPRDYFRMTLTNPGWTNKGFKLKERSINIDEPNLMSIEAVEYNPDIYKKNGTPIYTPDKLTWKNPYAPPAQVENANLSVRRIGENVIISITFTNPNDGNYDYSEIYISKFDDDNNWGDYKGNAINSFVIQNVDIGITYTIRILSVSKMGVRGITSVKQSVYIDPIIKLKPPTVEDFVATLIEGTLLFKWDSVDISDFYYYEIREGISWESGELVASNIKSTEWSTLNIPLDAGAYKYWIKAFDIYDEESEEATEFILTVEEDKNTKLIFTRSEKSNNWIFHSGITGIGSTTTEIILDTTASTIDDYYNNMYIYVGTLGGGYIKNYTGSTRKIELMSGYNFEIAPPQSMKYEIIGIDNRMYKLRDDNVLILNSRKRPIDFRAYTQ